MNKRKGFRTIIVFVIVIGIVLYIMWSIDKAVKEMDDIKDEFFDAFITRNFDELDQIMADDAWFVAQGRSYNELRDGIRENFETFENAVFPDDMDISTDFPGRRLGTPDFRKMLVDYKITFVEQNTERIYVASGRLEISRMQGGTHKITLVDLKVFGLDGMGIIDIKEDIFGPIL